MLLRALHALAEGQHVRAGAAHLAAEHATDHAAHHAAHHAALHAALTPPSTSASVGSGLGSGSFSGGFVLRNLLGLDDRVRLLTASSPSSAWAGPAAEAEEAAAAEAPWRP